MKEIVAIIPAFKVTNPDKPIVHPLKREALLFDKIALVNFETLHDKRLKELVDPTVSQELFWLYEKGIVVNPEELLKGQGAELEELQTYERDYNVEIRRIYNSFKRHQGKKGAPPNFVANAVKTFDIQARMVGIRLRKCCDMDAHPLLLQNLPDVQGRNVDKSEVLQILVKQLPTPSDDTPWEEIEEFRMDPQSREKFMRLRNWMSDVARMKLKHSEVEDKLETLLLDYRNHMKLHKMKTRQGSLKTIVLAEAGLISGGWLTGLGPLPSLVGAVVTPLFTIRQRQVVLMEEEQKAPGRDVAYIDQARRSFKLS